ncbi:YhbY family RNA-binding protein [Quisquiliibacterium transsilvanicum]|uniref:RNA-binding protein n=1 Tax=Quisquiliibacterium transsilvanicum TaxID=1549638 RepID=A0A7W8M916_9BURK|nr:YhbY family RNA-binding protein [Quisquiliibacterium transsilvanicum]MBB5272383.1 RNA-binding protein [Quisquiliibacterium transsilvanicum]
MQSTESPELAPVLTPTERKELRARAHHLDPVILIGEAGLTEAVLMEARRAIEVHELIKIRVFGDDRELRQSIMTQLCESLACAPVQMIGKLLVVYRPKPAEAQSRPRGPHVPKKAAAIGKTSAPSRGSRRPAAVKPAAEATPRAKVWGIEATGRPTTHASREDPRGSRAGRPLANRGGGLSAPRGPASRGGRGPGAQGPSRTQGKSGGRKR